MIIWVINLWIRWMIYNVDDQLNDHVDDQLNDHVYFQPKDHISSIAITACL